MNGTYIKLYRKLLDWEWYSDTNCVRLFLHLLLKANWEESNYRGYHIPRGGVVVGRKALAEELGMSEREIRTTSKRLTKCHAIDQQTTNKFTIVTICNFDTYNPKVDAKNNQIAAKRPASVIANDQQVTTSKEYNNNKKIKEINCDEQKRKILFKEAKGYFNGLDYDNAWNKFTWICEQNNEVRTEERWAKYINK